MQFWIWQYFLYLTDSCFTLLNNILTSNIHIILKLYKWQNTILRRMYFLLNLFVAVKSGFMFVIIHGKLFSVSFPITSWSPKKFLSRLRLGINVWLFFLNKKQLKWKSSHIYAQQCFMTTFLVTSCFFLTVWLYSHCAIVRDVEETM